MISAVEGASPAVSAAPLTGRARWLELAEFYLRPLAALMQPGKAGLPLAGPPSNHGSIADVLESFARPCLWAVHWLQAAAPDDPDDPSPGGLSRHRIAEWLRRGLVLGSDPDSPEYWGPTTNHHQHAVEMGALVLALEMARPWLWEPLSKAERERVARWMGSVRGSGLHRNNHLFFGVLPLCFLDKEGFGRAGDLTCVRRWLDTLERMSLGGGWFIDGMNESVDHYNAYSFHYYGLWWGRLFGALDPARSGRWRDWTREFLADYAHFFAASGEPVPFGRSLAYRFGVVAPFALAELCGASPLPPGECRRLCTGALEFFHAHPITQAQGALSLGWTDEFPAVAEAYSCAGSTYWAAKGLSPLLLGPDAPFWTAPDSPTPAERGDGARAIPTAGLVVRQVDGEVELLNAASHITGSNVAFGSWKWSKLSYRTGTGFEIGREGAPYPIDAALTAEAEGGQTFGRHYTHPLEVSADHLVTAYVLGDRFTQFNVQLESRLWWHGGWLLHVHRYTAHQPCRLRLGAQSLGAPSPDGFTHNGDFPFTYARNGAHGVAMQSLGGWQAAGHRRTVAGRDARVHLRDENSLTLYLEAAVRTRGEEGMLVALVWTGAAARLPAVGWQLADGVPGRWTFLFPTTGERWTVSHESLSALS